MKRFLLVLLLTILAPGIRAQAIEFNKRFSSPDIDGPYEILCSKGCVSLQTWGFRSITLGNQFFLSASVYSLSPIGDTAFRYWFNPFENVNIDIIFKDDEVVIVRMLEKTSAPGQVSTFGNINFLKIHHQTGKVDWLRSIPTLGPLRGNYAGSFPLGSFATNNNTILFISSREYYPNTGNALHPFIQEYDTSGFLLRETDFLNPGNNPSAKGSACKLPDGDVFISQLERTGNTNKHYAIWIDGATHSVYKRKYLPFDFTYERTNQFKIEVIKPGDKYLVYAKGRRLGGSPNDILTYCYLTDSSLGFQNLFWVKPNEDVLYAKALDDGNIMVLREGQNTIFVEKWNSLNGNVIFSTPVYWQGIVGQGDGLIRSYDIDDSGSVYITGSTYFSGPNKSDIWLAKIRNVGIKWDAWATGPQGLANENKPLSLFAYPNPTSGRFRVRGYKEEEGLTLRLFNNSGKEVWRGVPSPDGEVDISNLSPGLYHLEALTTTGKRWSTRVVRE